jgi:hypothetical protein
MKRKVGRKTVKRRKERIAGTNTKRRQSSLRAVRPTADAIGSVSAYINKSAINEFLSTPNRQKSCHTDILTKLNEVSTLEPNRKNVKLHQGLPFTSFNIMTTLPPTTMYRHKQNLNYS